jgi:SAM-dependent methyltransferase
MKKEWLRLLADPLTGQPLHLSGKPVIKKGRIMSGKLVSKSGNIYSIKKGIPVFLTSQTQTVNSVASFAYEWNQWGFLYAKDGWLRDIIQPILGQVSEFKNKIIVDAGAGSGAQSRWMAEAGAKLVISLELSDAIFNRHRKTIQGYEEAIFPIQCDIAYPPLSIKPDIVYCVNVLQHTANPKQTFQNIAALVSKKGSFIFNVYNKEGILGSVIVRMIRMLVSRLPFKVWRWVSFILALATYISLNSIIPFKNFGSRRFNVPNAFKELWLDIYDAFGPHYFQQCLTDQEQVTMFRECGLKISNKTKFGYLLTRADKYNKKKGKNEY